MHEFVAGLTPTHIPASCLAGDLEALFHSWDRDHDGILTLNELEWALGDA